MKIRLGPKFPHGKGRCLIVITYAPCEQGFELKLEGPKSSSLEITTCKTTNKPPPKPTLWKSASSLGSARPLIFCIENPWILQLPGRRKAAWTPVLRVVTSLGIIWRGERWVKNESDTYFINIHEPSYIGPFRLVGFGYGLTVLSNDLLDSLLAFCVFGVDSWCIDLCS